MYPLYERYYRTEVRNALNDANPARVTTRLRDVLNDADAAVMTALSSEEDLSVGGFYLRDIPSVHLGQLFEMIRESFVTLGQPEFVVVHDERTPHVQGHRIELLQAIRSVIIERDSPNAEVVRSRINFDFLETVEEPNTATE